MRGYLADVLVFVRQDRRAKFCDIDDRIFLKAR